MSKIVWESEADVSHNIIDNKAVLVILKRVETHLFFIQIESGLPQKLLKTLYDCKQYKTIFISS